MRPIGSAVTFLACNKLTRPEGGEAGREAGGEAEGESVGEAGGEAGRGRLGERGCESSVRESFGR